MPPTPLSNGVREHPRRRPFTAALRMLALLMPALLMSQGVAGAPGAPASPETVALAFQQRSTLTGRDLAVQFVGYRDSRCPADLQCAWAGEAWAYFWVSGGGLKPQLISLPWDGSFQPARYSRRLGAYRVYLQSLEPRPLAGAQRDPGSYQALLQFAHP